MQRYWFVSLGEFASWALTRRKPDFPAETAEAGLQRRARLCRRIQGMGVRDPKQRNARRLQRLLGDRYIPAMVRLEAARTLAKWDPRLAVPMVEDILKSSKEISLLKLRLLEAAKYWKDARLAPVLASLANGADPELAQAARAALARLASRN